MMTHQFKYRLCVYIFRLDEDQDFIPVNILIFLKHLRFLSLFYTFRNTFDTYCYKMMEVKVGLYVFVVHILSCNIALKGSTFAHRCTTHFRICILCKLSVQWFFVSLRFCQ